MKNVWIIPIVVLSVFACSETKEKPLTPIYADAFYEPDFIPYLMLKHGVDTIKEVINGQVGIVHVFNKKSDTYRKKVFSSFVWGEGKLRNAEVIVFCDSLIMYQVKIGWDVVEQFRYIYHRKQDTILKIVEGANFMISDEDSIIVLPVSDERYLKRHSVIPDSNKAEKFIFNKGQLYAIKDFGYKKVFYYDSLKRIVKSHEDFRDYDDTTKSYGYTKKEYLWKDNKLINVFKEESFLGIMPKPRVEKKYFDNSLPFKEDHLNIDSNKFYHSMDYQIIRNPK
ncbi:MAG: hypothetical protein ACLGGV_06085 [Bacteroidia bacterium]